MSDETSGGGRQTLPGAVTGSGWLVEELSQVDGAWWPPAYPPASLALEKHKHWLQEIRSDFEKNYRIQKLKRKSNLYDYFRNMRLSSRGCNINELSFRKMILFSNIWFCIFAVTNWDRFTTPDRFLRITAAYIVYRHLHQSTRITPTPVWQNHLRR